VNNDDLLNMVPSIIERMLRDERDAEWSRKNLSRVQEIARRKFQRQDEDVQRKRETRDVIKDARKRGIDVDAITRKVLLDLIEEEKNVRRG